MNKIGITSIKSLGKIVTGFSGAELEKLIIQNKDTLSALGSLKDWNAEQVNIKSNSLFKPN